MGAWLRSKDTHLSSSSVRIGLADAAPLYPLHRVSASVATMQNVADVIGSLKQRLDEPFVTVNSVTGDLGIKQAQDEYARLMRNKLPKKR